MIICIKREEKRKEGIAGKKLKNCLKKGMWRKNEAAFQLWLQSGNK